jgi:hypothetical protein
MPRQSSPPASGHGNFRLALAPLAALTFMAVIALVGEPTARGEETRACLLLEGRLVGAAEIDDVAKTWDAAIELYSGAEALRIVAALGSPYLPDDVEGAALIVFAAEGKERIFLMQGDCVRAATIVSLDDWDAARREALGDPA